MRRKEIIPGGAVLFSLVVIAFCTLQSHSAQVDVATREDELLAQALETGFLWSRGDATADAVVLEKYQSAVNAGYAEKALDQKRNQMSRWHGTKVHVAKAGTPELKAVYEAVASMLATDLPGPEIRMQAFSKFFDGTASRGVTCVGWLASITSAVEREGYIEAVIEVRPRLMSTSASDVFTHQACTETWHFFPDGTAQVVNVIPGREIAILFN